MYFSVRTAIFVVKQEAHLAASMTQLNIPLTNSSFQMYDDEFLYVFTYRKKTSLPLD